MTIILHSDSALYVFTRVLRLGRISSSLRLCSLNFYNSLRISSFLHSTFLLNLDMEIASSEIRIQHSVDNLNQQDDSKSAQRELESIEKYLKDEVYFLAAINSPELLNLIIRMFVTSITTMASISDLLSSFSIDSLQCKY